MSSKFEKFSWRPFAWNNLRAVFAESPLARERRELEEQYARVKAAHDASAYSGEDAALDFSIELVDEAARRANVRVPHDFDIRVKERVYVLTQEDPVIFWMPAFPDNLTAESATVLRTVLAAKERFLSDPARYEDVWREKVIRILEGFFGYLPLHVSSAPLSAAVYNLCPVHEVIERLLATMVDDDIVDAGLFTGVREQLERNLLRASGISATEAQKRSSDLLLPTRSKLDPGAVASTYLAHTAFEDLFSLSIPFAIPEDIRFQHQWVVAPTGSGKTQLLQTQIAADLEKVAAGDASLIVIDSQGLGKGRLLSNIAHLKVFAKGEPLHNKLVILEPDPEWPLALNLFDMGQYNSRLSARDRQILHTSALRMITFCLSDTTGQQQDMIEYLVQLAMVIPGATIDTVRQMLVAPKGEFLKMFEEPLGKVDEIVRDYFVHSFNPQGQNVTKEAVTRRIMGMLKNPTFRRMYQNKRNKFNMQWELEAGKVILINTDLALLGAEACELFGRFFISLLVQATQQRSGDRPVYCYIDECQDYIAADENIATLLDKARKQRVGFVFAHQRLANIRSANVLDALSNTAIKFAARTDTDATTLARYMRATPEMISNQEQLSFAAFVRNTTRQAVSLQVPYGRMEGMERMADAEYWEMRDRMRQEYCVDAAPRDEDPGPAKKAPPQEPPPKSVTDAQWDDVVR